MPPDSDHAEREAATVALDPIRPLRVTLKGLASLVAPTSLVTALLYYFGWARTSTQTTVLGLNDSLLGFSTQDYLLRSIDPMFWPLFVGILVTLGGLALHAGLVSWLGPAPSAEAPAGGLDRRRRRLLTRFCAAVAVAGAASLVLGIAGNNVDRPTRLVSLWSPLCVTSSIALLCYPVYLLRRYRGHSRRDKATREVQDFQFLGSILIVLLLFLSLFWSVARYAEIKGIDLALQVEEQLSELPDAVVYSTARLHLPEGVKETDLEPGDGSYRFRYSGLKLLFRSGDRVFLRPSGESVSHVNIVLPETDAVRFEFAAGGWQP